MEDLWNERKSDLYQCGISASPCFVQEVYVVIPLWRGSLQRGQRSQRTPWEEREDHVEEQDGTLLNQHSAERDHNQAFTQGLHNYLPNKGHFYITATLAWEGKWIVVILKVDWKWNVLSSAYEFMSRNSIIGQGAVPGKWVLLRQVLPLHYSWRWSIISSIITGIYSIICIY